MTFLLGRQAMLGQEPPTYLRSITAVRSPFFAKVQAMYLPGSPLPSTRTPYSSGACVGDPPRACISCSGPCSIVLRSELTGSRQFSFAVYLIRSSRVDCHRFLLLAGPGRSPALLSLAEVRDKSKHWIIRMPKVSPACKHEAVKVFVSRDSLGLHHDDLFKFSS